MIACVIGGGEGFLGSVDGVAEYLDDFVGAAEGGAVAEGGAAAVDAEGRGEGQKSEGGEADEGVGVMHG